MMQPREELTADARRELLRTRLPTGAPDGKIFAYSDSEWQQITTALRHDVRTCRDRTREGLRLLAAFRSGGLEVGSQEESLGRLLDVFARTGDLPRRQGPSGKRYHTREVLRLGGARGISRMLCLTGNEATAFALLICALTAENFGTVKKWPAAHTRPDGGFGAPGIALIEESKPRRGPEHEHTVIALEDFPSSLREVFEAENAESKLFRSPLRLYELLLELTQVARALGLPGADAPDEADCRSTCANLAYTDRDVTELRQELVRLQADAADPLAPKPRRDRAAAQAAQCLAIIERHHGGTTEDERGII